MPRAVVFDFDGVLASTFDLCLHLTRTFDRITIEPEEYKKFFDGNILAHGESQRLISFYDEDVRRALLAEYRTRLTTEHSLVPGMDNLIRELAATTPLHIITSGETASINHFLERHAVRPYFGSVLGFDIHHSKTHKLGLVGAQGDAASQYVYVTDTLGDIHEAHAAGVRAIGVSWGFHDAPRLAQGNPHTIVHSPAELLAAIQRMR